MWFAVGETQSIIYYDTSFYNASSGTSLGTRVTCVSSFWSWRKCTLLKVVSSIIRHWSFTLSVQTIGQERIAIRQVSSVSSARVSTATFCVRSLVSAFGLAMSGCRRTRCLMTIRVSFTDTNNTFPRIHTQDANSSPAHVSVCAGVSASEGACVCVCVYDVRYYISTTCMLYEDTLDCNLKIKENMKSNHFINPLNQTASHTHVWIDMNVYVLQNPVFSF